MIVTAPISVGELIDKITILEIKLERISDESKRNNILSEYSKLCDIVEELDIPQVDALWDKLYEVNNELWDIEDAKRNCEKTQVFDESFIQLARDVYLKNDQRAKIKREINLMIGSTIIEEKSY